jgi:hypothetical protein
MRICETSDRLGLRHGERNVGDGGFLHANGPDRQDLRIGDGAAICSMNGKGDRDMGEL